MLVVVVNSKVRPRVSAAGLFESVISLAPTYNASAMFARHSTSSKSPASVDAQRGFNKRAGDRGEVDEVGDEVG